MTEWLQHVNHISNGDLLGVILNGFAAGAWLMYFWNLYLDRRHAPKGGLK